MHFKLLMLTREDWYWISKSFNESEKEIKNEKEEITCKVRLKRCVSDDTKDVSLLIWAIAFNVFW